MTASVPGDGVEREDGSEVREEWGVWWRAYATGETDRFASCSDERDARHLAGDMRMDPDVSLVRIRRRTVTTGPWVEVEHG